MQDAQKDKVLMVAQSKMSLVGIGVLWFAIQAYQLSAATEQAPVEINLATHPPEVTWPRPRHPSPRRRSRQRVYRRQA
jgi:hypothetical protein